MVAVGFVMPEKRINNKNKKLCYTQKLTSISQMR